MEKWTIIILSTLVLILLCWKEISRKNKSHVYFRLAASVLAVLSLYFIVKPLSFQRKHDPSSENTAVLLTAGYHIDSLNRLKNIPLYSTDPSITAGNKTVKLIPDLEYFSRTQADVNKIHILGNGLEQHELEAIKDRQLFFHPSGISGLHDVNWNQRVRSGDRLIVQGSFKNGSEREVKILLRGLSTTLDSVLISGNQSFELSTIPKQLNEAVFTLHVLAGRDTLAHEKIPVIIEDKIPFKILMLSSSPNFENKFLKSWLSSERYALASRTAISKNKFSTEFLNLEARNLSRISPTLLREFDILIGDVTELSQLSSAESSAIQNAAGMGMGLVLRSDIAGGSGFYKNAFSVRQSRGIDQKNVSLKWEGRIAKKTAPPAGSGLEILSRPGDQVLVRDNKNHVLASAKMFGQGRIIGTTVSDTYTWMLSNNSSDYSAFWSYILGKAARKTGAADAWSILNKYPLVNKATPIQLETASEGIPSASVENVPLYFAQEPTQLYRWRAEYWPSASGWQSIRSGSKETSWYAYDEKDWQTARAALKAGNNLKFIHEQNTVIKSRPGVQKTYLYTFPAMWFYLLFLVGMGYLWWEGKIRD